MNPKINILLQGGGNMKVDYSKWAFQIYYFIKVLDKGPGAYIRHINICTDLKQYQRKKTFEYLQQEGFIFECKPKYWKIKKEWICKND